MNTYKELIKQHHTEVVDVMPVDNPVGQLKLRLLRQTIRPNDAVLDVGAGNGVITKEARRLSADVTAMDFTPKMIDQLYKIEGIIICYGDITDGAGFDNTSFDVVYSFGTLYYIQELDLALHEIHRLLKNNGKAVLEFENALSPLKFWVDRQYHLPQKRVYPWQLKTLLNGFTIKKTHYHKLFPSFTGWWSTTMLFGKIPLLKYFCLSIIVEVKKC